MPLVAEMDVRALLPAVRVPTLVVQHADDSDDPTPSGARTSLITCRARNTLSCRVATCTTSLNQDGRVFLEIAEI